MIAKFEDKIREYKKTSSTNEHLDMTELNEALRKEKWRQ